MQDQTNFESPDLANMSEDELVSSIVTLKLSKKQTEDRIKVLEGELLFRNEEAIKMALALKDEPFGIVHVGNLKYNVAKAVIWDQDRLADIHKDISSHGQDPLQYMVVTYKVKESAFKNWPDDLQDAFIDARTIKAGTPKLAVGGEE